MGDRYWQKQKIRQLPAHDIDLIYCNELTDEECKQMELFIKIRREKFLGRGIVRNTFDSGPDNVRTIANLYSIHFMKIFMVIHFRCAASVVFHLKEER